MNLEGKRQIWKDYQKEIADDKYYYARSCIRQTFFPGSEWAYLDILGHKLGKTVLDDPIPPAQASAIIRTLYLSKPL